MRISPRNIRSSFIQNFFRQSMKRGFDVLASGIGLLIPIANISHHYHPDQARFTRPGLFLVPEDGKAWTPLPHVEIQDHVRAPQ